MAYNTASLIDDVIDESKDPGFSRPRVLGYLQRTQDSVLGRSRLKFNEKRITASLNVSDTSYTPETGYQETIQLVLMHADLSTPAEPCYLSNQEFFDRYADVENLPAGLPTYYTDFGGDIYFDRPLDKAYTLGLRFTQASSTLTDTTESVPQIPREYDAIYLHGGLAGIEAYRENFDLEAIHLRRVEDTAEDLLGRYGLRKRQPGKARPIRRRGQNEW